MKIVSGLGSVDDYIPLAEAGADEFFCGYVPNEWLSRYGVFLPLNRREVLYYNVQIGSASELKILCKMVEHYGVPVKITFNSLYYLPEQYPVVAKLIKDCMAIGFDTFIIADVALILYLRQHGVECRIHLSGETAEVNHLMIEQMNEFHITRYIFHRKNTIADMKACINSQKGRNLEFEAFILNEYCQFTGAFCNSLHCDELPHLCKVPYRMGKLRNVGGNFENVWEKLSQSNEAEMEGDVELENGDILKCIEDNLEEEYQTGSSGCGLCALKQLNDAGVTHLKLVGRGNYVDYMVKDIQVLKRAIRMAEEVEKEKMYKKEVRERLLRWGCLENCYYLERR